MEPGCGSFESRALCNTARKRTGLQHFGEPEIEPALTILLNSLKREAGLHRLGRRLMTIHLLGLLMVRLRLANCWLADEIGPSAKIVRPIFITGMPRSGSTFLHELLAQEPGLRAPRAWEVMFPPMARTRTLKARRFAILKSAFCLWWFRHLARDADAVYPLRALTPHECVAIHSHTFLSEEFVSTCHVPTYKNFLGSADLRPAYAWERRFLQHLQSPSNRTQWALKSPDHARHLEALFTVFPDALIIQTHRNPLHCLKSAVKLTRVLQGLYGKPRSDEELVENESFHLASSIEYLLRFRDANPALKERFVDVDYSALTSNPLNTIRNIFHRFKLDLSETTILKVEHFASKRSAYKGIRPRVGSLVPNVNSCERLNIFRDYCGRFGLPFVGP